MSWEWNVCITITSRMWLRWNGRCVWAQSFRFRQIWNKVEWIAATDFTYRYADCGSESDLTLCCVFCIVAFWKRRPWSALSTQRRSSFVPAFIGFQVMTPATIMTQNRRERQLLLCCSTQIVCLSANRRPVVTVKITVAGGIHQASTSSHVLKACWEKKKKNCSGKTSKKENS